MFTGWKYVLIDIKDFPASLSIALLIKSKPDVLRGETQKRGRREGETREVEKGRRVEGRGGEKSPGRKTFEAIQRIRNISGFETNNVEHLCFYKLLTNT